ncbi:MAG TPA: hypothetical protein VFM20_03650 [Nitrososphaeraceae archaeon]|nr:hypothetical protein [Nitrososphaeraceae archaeon]
MHKLSTKMHKKNENVLRNNESDLGILSNADIDRENRLSNIISLHSKGLNQSAIAKELGVDQSTVSRDLQIIKEQTRSQLDKYFREDILFEIISYLAGSTEVIKELWQIVETNYDDPKQQINALKLLNQAYENRQQRIIGGPESYLKIKTTVSDLDYQDFIERDPEAKALAQLQKLDPKGTIFGSGNSLNRKLNQK